MRNSLRAAAAFYAFEGVLALLAASGLLMLVHKDLDDLALLLVEHAHLNPAAHYPHIFIDAATHLENTRFTLLALGAVAYSLYHFVEAYGLYHGAAWAEALAALSSTVFVPIEVVDIIRHFSLTGAGMLALNMVVVIIAVVALRQRRKT